jgi:hypothetical protein
MRRSGRIVDPQAGIFHTMYGRKLRCNLDEAAKSLDYPL